MATTLEAIMGAVFLDRGEAAMQAVMARLGLDHALLHVVMFLSPHCAKPPTPVLLYG